MYLIALLSALVRCGVHQSNMYNSTVHYSVGCLWRPLEECEKFFLFSVLFYENEPISMKILYYFRVSKRARKWSTMEQGAGRSRSC
jgi:hypothetical protein